MKTAAQILPVSRRHFLRAGATTVAAISLVPRHVLGGPRFVPPSEQVNVAIIGAGGQGRTNTRALLAEPAARVIAVCDPNEQADYDRFYYKGVAGRKPVKAEVEKHYGEKTPGFRCAEYEDFRVMLEKEKAVDAILCATPDHLHAFVCVTAMRQGKHAYCEKPLSHNIWEARLMARVARETGVATQLGNQGHSGEGIRQTCEWLWDGAIGTVREVHAWSSAAKWFRNTGRPTETPPVPAGMNWDLWLGPREARPYHPTYAPVTWRSYWAFGTGTIGDFICHNLDPAVWALDLKAPLTIEACSSGLDAETLPISAIYRYQFGQRGQYPPLKVVWYEGGLYPERPAELEDDEVLGGGANGILFLGDKGSMMCAGWGGAPRLIPTAKMDAYKRPTPTLPRSKGHHRDWLEACKGGKPASSNFDYGARITEIGLLGHVALRTGKRLVWDYDNMKVKNAPEAERFLKETYRPGWEPA